MEKKKRVRKFANGGKYARMEFNKNLWGDTKQMLNGKQRGEFTKDEQEIRTKNKNEKRKKKYIKKN